MNLIQVQEHLKDMPIRAIMEYANGKNPQVPPYLALGELNRRKQMEQSARTGTPPDGTVKDKLEKELTGQAADLMQAGAARQAQSNQQLQQSLMGQPQPVPEGTPQPPQPEEEMPEMPQMAAGGLTTLPTRDMFKFAGGGGVVAFAEGDVVIDQAEQAAREAKESLRRYGLMQRRQDPEGYAAAQQADAAAQAAYQNAKSQYEQQMGQSGMDKAAFNMKDVGALKAQMGLGAPSTPRQSARITPTFSPDDQSAAETARLARQNAGPPMGIASVAPPPIPPMPAPAGGRIPASIKMPGAPSFEAPDKDAYKNELAAFKAANPGVAGSEFQKLLDKIAKQDEDDRAKFITQEKGRTRADFWQALIDAGESTRGQKGIGALLGGFGRSAGASQAKADERENAQIKMRRDQEMGMAKMRAELEAARRAEARGDFEAAFKHKQDAEKIGLDLKQKEFSNQMDIAKLQEQARGNSIQAAGQNRLPQLVQVAEDIQRKNPQMSPNEAMERAASYLASGQYQSAAQRDKAATAKALNEKTQFLDQMMMNLDPSSSDYKKYKTQRDLVIQQFLQDQAMLAGKSAPATAIKGTVERIG
jgi:hypothetical protein